MGDWILRAASFDDTEVIAELRAVVMRADLTRVGRFDPVRVRERFREHFDPECAWVIEVAGEFAGSVALRPEEDGYWLEHFFLDPRHQGRGIGSGVLDEVLGGCAGDVRLQVLQGSAARRLYERHGFVAESEDEIDVWMLRQARRASA